MLALDLQDLLEDAGFAVAGMVGKLDKAMTMIESTPCDAAIVDANLCGVSSGPAAAALAARGVPFIVLSGYSLKQLPAAFPKAIFIQKPCRPVQLINALKAIRMQQ